MIVTLIGVYVKMLKCKGKNFFATNIIKIFYIPNQNGTYKRLVFLHQNKYYTRYGNITCLILFMSFRNLFALFCSFMLLYSCNHVEEKTLRFKKLNPRQTGVTFVNTITTNDSLNYASDFLLYNGAGVAIGDINNDSLPDLYFAGNMVSSRLYLNKGDMRFEDITETAGVTTTQRATGVSMVDIDNNGYLDIYVSVSGPEWSKAGERSNLLFVNNGDNTFTELAEKLDVDDTGFTTHSVFFDYDKDSDLDLFVLNNSPGEFARGETGLDTFGSQEPDSSGFDQLYRNNGDGSFTHISAEAGILRKIGYGLGVVVADLNKDSWPDIYVSNDITPNDVLYINNGDGTFTDKAGEWLRHTSYSGMGIDIADFDNNGWPDILQTDMVPKSLAERKRMLGAETYNKFIGLRNRGFFPHYNLNTLQLNLGATGNGKPIFSEIARMAGVAYTNWSWSALFADYDNDGFKDIFITNGYPKAIIDFDFQTNMHRARRLGNNQSSRQKVQEILDNVHSYEISNCVFRNETDLTFSDRTQEWGMNYPSYSYGAAYSDLNNDGRLDLVINNLNAAASVYQNTAPGNDMNHYLQVRLEGEPPNRQGIGTKLILWAGNQKQYIDHTPYRGYMSTMDDRIHFGLGDADRVDSLKVIWPDGSYQLLTELQADKILTIYQKNSVSQQKQSPSFTLSGSRIFRSINDLGLKYKHRENQHSVDYNMQPLLPYEISRQGPPLAVGDVTGNGLDDIFIGGDAGFAGRLFIQQKNGRFVESDKLQPWQADKDYEDWGAHFFDANGNGLLDLYVASGGYRLSPVSSLLQDRLYINQGNGRFEKDTLALPEIRTSTSSVASGDFTGDGQPDLFVGGRLVPGNYPYPTRSYLLRNDGGRFTDITSETTSELVEPGGMITDAVWIDYNRDGRLDLVTAGVWMPVQFYESDGKRLRNVTGKTGLPPMRGWWYSLEKGDFNKDGYPDLVAGNLGLNYTYTTSKESRFGVYAADFDRNRTSDIIFTQEIDGTEYPFYGLAKLGKEILDISLKFQTYESFSKAAIEQVISQARLNEALHYQVDTFASTYLQNNGDGTFIPNKLSSLAQISPINSIIVHDLDGDDNLDLIVAGNLHYIEPNTPRADAGNGLWLKGDEQGNFTPVPPLKSSLLASLNVKDLALVTTPDGKAIIIANNSDSLQAFKLNPNR